MRLLLGCTERAEQAGTRGIDAKCTGNRPRRVVGGGRRFRCCCRTNLATSPAIFTLPPPKSASVIPVNACGIGKCGCSQRHSPRRWHRLRHSPRSPSPCQRWCHLHTSLSGVRGVGSASKFAVSVAVAVKCPAWASDSAPAVTVLVAYLPAAGPLYVALPLRPTISPVGYSWFVVAPEKTSTLCLSVFFAGFLATSRSMHTPYQGHHTLRLGW